MSWTTRVWDQLAPPYCPWYTFAMKRSLLAYSTSAAFHAHFDSLNQHSNSIAIHCVSAIQTFFECISHQPYDAVLIDASNRDLPLSLITVDLLEQNPDIKILLLSPDPFVFNGRPLAEKNCVATDCGIRSRLFLLLGLAFGRQNLFCTRS